MNLWINTFIKFFFLLTPFWVISTFLSMTQGKSLGARRKLAIRVTLAVIVACAVLIFGGNAIFRMFDITIDSFRIGAGCLLFLSAVSLVKGSSNATPVNDGHDIAVVPLAIPITVGPGTTGALLVMGTEFQSYGDKAIAGTALLTAVLVVGLLLYLASGVEKILGQKGLNVLSKLTGLILSALSAQLVMTGVMGMLRDHL
jgi:multiple antibiotic resistance protein